MKAVAGRCRPPLARTRQSSHLEKASVSPQGLGPRRVVGNGLTSSRAGGPAVPDLTGVTARCASRSGQGVPAAPAGFARHPSGPVPLPAHTPGGRCGLWSGRRGMRPSSRRTLPQRAVRPRRRDGGELLPCPNLPVRGPRPAPEAIRGTDTAGATGTGIRGVGGVGRLSAVFCAKPLKTHKSAKGQGAPLSPEAQFSRPLSLGRGCPGGAGEGRCADKALGAKRRHSHTSTSPCPLIRPAGTFSPGRRVG